MAEQVRLKNTSARVTETIYVGGDAVRVVPQATVLVPTDHYATSKVPNLRLVDANEKPLPATPREAQLQKQIDELKAQIAASQAPANEADETSEDDGDSDDAPDFPTHAGGGKWTLSNGETTRGGLKRAEAEELEAALHQ